jgi:hypothetical protein
MPDPFGSFNWLCTFILFGPREGTDIVLKKKKEKEEKEGS